MIKNIVFDFGGVLVQYNFRTFFEQLLGSWERADWFLTHVFTAEINYEMDRGLLSPRQIISRQQALWPDYRDALEAFYTHYTDIFTAETAGMRQLMNDLRAQGYRLLGLSNWSEKVYDVMQKFDIFDLLDGYLLSKDVHQLKPYTDIYQSFLSRFDVQPHECVFIDDKPENIDGCKEAGMYGITFRDTEQLRRELSPLLTSYRFSLAQPDNECAAWDIVHQSALDMVAKGRHQWDGEYPPRQTIADDIAARRGYILHVDGREAAYTAISFDGEPSYEQLQGQWLSTGPYATIHRTAVALSHRRQGLGRIILAEAERLCRQRGIGSIRIDTNHDNDEMLGLIRQLGFRQCGLCYYQRGAQRIERMAFELLLHKPVHHF